MSGISSRDRLRRVSALAALVVTLLNACGGGSGDSSGPSAPPPPPPPPPAPATALSLLAGNADGAGTQDGPAPGVARVGVDVGGMAVTPQGDVVFLDTGNHRVRKLSAGSAHITTVAGGGGWVRTGAVSNHADGDGPAARFYQPKAVAVDTAGNMYVADTENHLVRRISPTGAVTTLAGKPGVCGNQDGTSDTATFCRPSSIAVDKAGTVYVAETRPSSTTLSAANPIRKISNTGQVSTLTSKASEYPTSIFFSGPPIQIYYPVHLATDSTGALYAADPNDHVVRRYATDGQATVVSGTVGPNNQGTTDGTASQAKFGAFKAMAFDAADRLFVLDNTGLPAIRRIGSDGSATTLVRAQGCTESHAPGSLCLANQMTVRPDGSFLVSEYGMQGNTFQYSQLRSYSPQGTSTLVAGLASAPGADDGQGGSARFDAPGALAWSPSGTLYVRDDGNRSLRTVMPDGVVRTLGTPGGHCTTVGGLGSEVLSSFTAPLATDGAGALYTLQEARVFKTSACQAALWADLKPLLDKVPTFFTSVASGIAADRTGNVYVSTFKGTIHKIDAKGEVTLLAGSLGTVGHADGQGAAAQFSALGNMATDAAGNVYVVDGLFHEVNKIGPTIRKITPSGMVSTLAGNPAAAPGYADGTGAAAVFTVDLGFRYPQQTAALAVDAQGNVYITDGAHHVVRRITPDGRVSPLVGQFGASGFAAGDLPGLIHRPAGIAVRDNMLYFSMPNAVAQVKLPAQ